MLWGGELILREGQPVGDVCSAAYGHTLGRSATLALIENTSSVDRAFLEAGRFEADLAGDRFAVAACFSPAYDPEGLRVKSWRSPRVLCILFATCCRPSAFAKQGPVLGPVTNGSDKRACCAET